MGRQAAPVAFAGGGPVGGGATGPGRAEAAPVAVAVAGPAAGGRCGSG